MKRLWFYLSFCLLLAACHSSSKAGREPAFEVSTSTKMFIEQLKGENPAKPSAAFLQLFPLRQVQGQYYVSGLVKRRADLNEKDLEKLGAKINTRAGNIFTLQIPLKNFKRFLSSRGISYFELAQPIPIDSTK